MDVDEEEGNLTSSTDTSGSAGRPSPGATPVPDSPASSVHFPAPPYATVQRPELESSCDGRCEPYQAPVADRAPYVQVT